MQYFISHSQYNNLFKPFCKKSFQLQVNCSARILLDWISIFLWYSCCNKYCTVFFKDDLCTLFNMFLLFRDKNWAIHLSILVVPGQNWVRVDEQTADTMESCVRITGTYFSDYLGPLLLTWCNLFPAWISKMWNEINYPFPNFNGSTVKVW